MARVIITAAAMAAVRGAAEGGGSFSRTAIRQKDGSFDIELSEEVQERLQAARLDGETLSDVIERVCITFGKKAN